MRFFQRCFQLILQMGFVRRPLIPCTCKCPPKSLFGIGHEAQSQLLGDQSLHQTFRIPKVFLSPTSSAVGQRLRQMECSRHLLGTFPILTARFPGPFECAPKRFPVLGRGFHHHFLDPLLDQPLRQSLQLLWVASEPASLKLVFLADFNVSHNYGPLLFVPINSGYPIPHRLPPGGGGEPAGDYIKQGLGLSPLPQGVRPRTIYSLDHARSGSDTCTASGSPLCTQSRRSEPAWIMAWALRNFHVLSRAAGPN